MVIIFLVIVEVFIGFIIIIDIGVVVILLIVVMAGDSLSRSDLYYRMALIFFSIIIN